MSTLEGNPSATISVVAGSATSSVEAGFAALSAPGSDDPVDRSEPVLRRPSRDETTISGGGGRRITVTLKRPINPKY